MRNLLIIFALINFILVSCEDKEERSLTVAEGYVIHSGTKKPLEGVRVSIWDGLPSTDPLSTDSKSSGNYHVTFTDSTGFFHIELNAKEPVMFLSKQDYTFEYHIDGAVIGIIPLMVGENKNLLFEMDAWAYFNPWLKGSNSLINDTVLFDLISSNGIKEGWLCTYKGNGPFKFSSFDGYLAKGDKFKIYWLKYQIHGMWYERLDSVYIPSFTTFSDTIYY
jgi:hypothetical protein